MKKIKLTLASIGSALLLPALALALDGFTPPGEASVGSMPILIQRIETFVWMLFGLIAVISFVVAGILFLTAGGQPEKVQSARNAFIWGVAGVVVGIIAYSILAIIGSAVGV